MGVSPTLMTMDLSPSLMTMDLDTVALDHLIMPEPLCAGIIQLTEKVFDGVVIFGGCIPDAHASGFKF